MAGLCAVLERGDGTAELKRMIVDEGASHCLRREGMTPKCAQGSPLGVGAWRISAYAEAGDFTDREEE